MSIGEVSPIAHSLTEAGVPTGTEIPVLPDRLFNCRLLVTYVTTAVTVGVTVGVLFGTVLAGLLRAGARLQRVATRMIF